MSGSDNGESRGPLAGVRVLEFGQIAAGPFAGSLLADLGADVVKVENPAGGDGMRGWPPLSSTDGGPGFSENFASTGKAGTRTGASHPRNHPYQAYRAQDDYFIIAAGNAALWREVAEAVGLPELIADPRFDSQLQRARNQVALAGLLEAKFAARPAREWLAEMDRRGVPAQRR